MDIKFLVLPESRIAYDPTPGDPSDNGRLWRVTFRNGSKFVSVLLWASVVIGFASTTVRGALFGLSHLGDNVSNSAFWDKIGPFVDDILFATSPVWVGSLTPSRSLFAPRWF